MTPKLHLPDVTLVMMDGTCPELAKLAVEDCLAAASFGDSVIFSDAPITVDGARYVEVPKWRSLLDVINFVWLDLPFRITTSHLLFCQWDGWIVDPAMWSDEFLQYDYIGAPWWYDDGLNVGNGCGLRSIRLMRFLAVHQDRFPVPAGEDDGLCRGYRPALEREGFRWASEHLASRFAFECTRPSPQSRHFMFHDSFNFPFVLTPDRLAERLRLMLENPYIRGGRKIAELRAGRCPLILARLASIPAVA
jgi:hypothetical protein